MEEKITDRAVFDKDEALKMFDDDVAFLKELVEIFINDAPGHMSEIKEAVDSRNSKALDKSAHKLKGAVANIGKNVTTDTAFKLETMGKESNLDGVEDVFDTLVKDVDDLMNALKKFVKSD